MEDTGKGKPVRSAPGNERGEVRIMWNMELGIKCNPSPEFSWIPKILITM